MVRLTGNHNIYFHTGIDSDHQRIQHGFIWNKVGGLNVDPLFCLGDQTQIIVMYPLPLGIRPAGYDLHQTIVSDTRFHIFKILFVSKKILFGRIIPVQQKSQLEPQNTGPLYPQMGISPISKFIFQSDILFSHVETAYICHFIIDFHIPVNNHRREFTWSQDISRLRIICNDHHTVCFYLFQHVNIRDLFFFIISGRT